MLKAFTFFEKTSEKFEYTPTKATVMTFLDQTQFWVEGHVRFLLIELKSQPTHTVIAS